MEYKIVKKMDCSDVFKCSDLILEKLGPLKLKLKAEKENDTVNGSLSIDHTKNHHVITVVLYEKNEKPNEKTRHDTTLQKVKNLPTLEEIIKLIKAK